MGAAGDRHLRKAQMGQYIGEGFAAEIAALTDDEAVGRLADGYRMAVDVATDEASGWGYEIGWQVMSQAYTAALYAMARDFYERGHLSFAAVFQLVAWTFRADHQRAVLAPELRRPRPLVEAITYFLDNHVPGPTDGRYGKHEGGE